MNSSLNARVEADSGHAAGVLMMRPCNGVIKKTCMRITCVIYISSTAGKITYFILLLAVKSVYIW